jgi:hypothetical protein
MVLRRRVLAVAAALVAAGSAVAAPAAAATGGRLGFGPAILLSHVLAGGEPTVMYDPVHHDYIYTSHEGTTHTLHDGVVNDPQESADFALNYRNQVNIWTSPDGNHWYPVNLDGTGFVSNPATNTGFSDPDLTEDAGGRVYDTGIDLANDALFSSTDGGRTWPTGTVNCNEGDRPWLAGALANEVFLATDTAIGSLTNPTVLGHTIYRSVNGGASCQDVGITDFGNLPAGYDKLPAGWSYTGYGKLWYDRRNGELVEPDEFTGPDGNIDGVGVSVLAGATREFNAVNAGASPVPNQAVSGGSAGFHPTLTARTNGFLDLFPSLAFDNRYQHLYMTWSDNPNGSGVNSVWLEELSPTGKVQWGPRIIAHPRRTVLWPWVVAGSPGNVSVVWYGYDRVVPNPDAATVVGNVAVYAENIYGLGTAHQVSQTVDASRGTMHSGGICQSGTTCVITAQDRRLGDYFTANLDARGCVMIATGDTALAPSAAWSLPILLRQNSGESLTGGTCDANARLRPAPRRSAAGAAMSSSVLASVSTRLPGDGAPAWRVPGLELAGLLLAVGLLSGAGRFGLRRLRTKGGSAALT